MQIYRDSECQQRIKTDGTVMDTTIVQIRQHLDDQRRLHYMHDNKCHTAKFTSAMGFTLSHDADEKEHVCSSEKATLGECIKGDDLPAFRDRLHQHGKPSDHSSSKNSDSENSTEVNFSSARFML